jgi:uncharacterized protein YggE
MRLKRTWLLLAVVLLLTALFIPTTYAEGTMPAMTTKTLEIMGTGRITYTYDMAEITLGVTQLADSPTAAFNQMNEAMNKVVGNVKAKGIAEADLKTGYLSLGPEYDWKDGTQTLRGYRASNTIVIKVKDLTKIASVMEAAVNAGANQVQGVQFGLSSADALQGTALEAAIDDAKARAERAAKKLGTSIAGVQKVQINDQSGPIRPYPVPYMAKDMAVGSTAAAAVFSGNGEYIVTVGITFELR